MKRFLLLAFLICGCSQTQDLPPHTYNWQVISSRDEGEPHSRFALYRAKIPVDWLRIDPAANKSLVDTMKPLCEFKIGEAIRITIHNFPSNQLKERIPPASQLARWKQQFDFLSADAYSITPLAKGGFTGLYLSATGILDGQPQTVLGWSMQMAPEQYLNLQENHFEQRQKRSDYTIKAVGDPETMEDHITEIQRFAQSFELIEEIPRR